MFFKDYFVSQDLSLRLILKDFIDKGFDRWLIQGLFALTGFNFNNFCQDYFVLQNFNYRKRLVCLRGFKLKDDFVFLD